MPAPVSPGKICIHCGEDCSARPRTKDAQGRYACKECHERALAGARGQAVKVARTPPPPAVEPAYGVDDDLVGSLAQGIGSAACVSCGAPIAPGAAICMSCGTNQATGERLNTKKMKAAKAPKSESSRGRSVAVNPAWIALGMIGVFGLLTALAYSSEGMLIALAGGMIVLTLGTYVTTIICAFKDGAPGWGVAAIVQFFVPCVGLAVLYYIFLVNERPMVKVLNAVSIIVGIMFLLVSMHHGVSLEELAG